MSFRIREMIIQDYEEVLALWRASEGIGLSGADSEHGIARFMQRNPGLCFVARDDSQLVGAVLCGHDGRRGYIHHLAISRSHRRQGTGKALVQRCLAGLRSAGIDKCHLFVFTDNHDAITFRERIGWLERAELTMMSQYTANGGAEARSDDRPESGHQARGGSTNTCLSSGRGDNNE